ncbi:hypothetical protein [Flagellimonas allohymeniacidonis]|uniref:DinB family protein n=1 Tax=Flagellimonas allohymeniacidonis TaxID=2517819 RepID=A0A4Q8QHW8_9FLAO|nr:hypothetical protein [Allomuricauda hymeniacidonis]TAI49564.1 hypothetical protein EW142_07130 [Allomuricauda hymeniacidonis]
MSILFWHISCSLPSIWRPELSKFADWSAPKPSNSQIDQRTVSVMNEKERKALNALNSTIKAFHQLIDSLTAQQLATKSKRSKRTVQGILAHILIATQYAYPLLLKKAKKQKPTPAFFGTRMGHYLSYRHSEFIGSRMDREALHFAFDRANWHLEKAMPKIKDHEWQLKTTLPKQTNRTLTVLEIFTFSGTSAFSGASGRNMGYHRGATLIHLCLPDQFDPIW